MQLNNYEQTLLDGWEEVYKKSQLTLWILLALKDGPKHMADIKSFIRTATHETIEADDKSMYRALRRFQDAELMHFTERDNPAGPKQKVFQLTETGNRVLAAFIARNITNVFLHPRIQKLLEK